MEPVVCPHCGAEGQPADSFINAEGRTVAYGRMTLLHSYPFRDAHGREHHHDPNRRSMDMRCEAGHRWVKRWHVPCWCGWPHSVKEGSGD